MNTLLKNITQTDIHFIAKNIIKQLDALKIKSLAEEKKAVKDYLERANLSYDDADTFNLFNHLAEDEKEHVKELITSLSKQIQTSAKERAKAKGLVPQSGDENHPGRWVKPEHQNKKTSTKKKGRHAVSKKNEKRRIIQAKNLPAKKT